MKGVFSMCGIIGYTGDSDAREIILKGLHTLEYRGYDSAGMTVFTNDGLKTVKTSGRVEELERKSDFLSDTETFCGIGHTRWATHGKPTERNCHPHGTKSVMVVHNGIIENYEELKKEFAPDSFYSDTDTEVVAKLIDREYGKTHDALLSVINTSKKLTGAYALGIVFADIPDTVFALRKDNPLLIGKSEDGMFIASDISAFSAYTDRYIRLDEGCAARITKKNVEIFGIDGMKKEIKEETYHGNHTETDKNGFPHFMLKEIHETPDAMRKTFGSITKDFLPCFSDDGFFENIGTIHIVACGTALHSGLVGKYFIEKLSGIRVLTETAGEFRYSEPVIKENDLAVIISQSGETADSIAALRMLNKMNIRTLSIVNTKESTIARESQKVIYTLAGKEVAVASTKAFNVQCQIMLSLAVKLALVNNKISTQKAREILLNHTAVYKESTQKVLRNIYQITSAAEILAKKPNAFFIGRGYDNHIASEGSLKLKEISYIHSEAYAASELKHGTISLIEEGTPVIAVATDKRFHNKLRSNIEEVKSRGAVVISICTENAREIKTISDAVIEIPEDTAFNNIFTSATAVQLLAYYTALKLGRDIDKPRNLAKSVTVE